MKKFIGRKFLMLLTAAVLSVSMALPATAAPAQVNIQKNEGTISTSYYEANLDKTLVLNYNYTERVQLVTNDNGTFMKYCVNARGTAIDQATGAVYRISDCVNQTTKAWYDSGANQFIAYEQVKFIGAGPDNNLFVTYKCVISNGEMTKSIMSIEVR